jgi:hypothetical protein
MLDTLITLLQGEYKMERLPIEKVQLRLLDTVETILMDAVENTEAHCGSGIDNDGREFVFVRSHAKKYYIRFEVLCNFNVRITSKYGSFDKELTILELYNRIENILKLAGVKTFTNNDVETLPPPPAQITFANPLHGFANEHVIVGTITK